MNWYYAGIEHSNKGRKIANPANLFRKGDGPRYTTSSKLVNRFVRWFGDPEIVELVEFTSAQEAIAFETDFLTKADIRKNKDVWLNRHVGGKNWCCTGHNAETRKKLSEANRGKVISDEHKAKLKLARSQQVFDNEARAKMSKAKKGKPGHPHTEEAKRKIGDAHRGKAKSEAHKEKMRLSSKGRKQTAETIEKRAESNRGQKRSDETKRRIAEGVKRRHAMRKEAATQVGNRTN